MPTPDSGAVAKGGLLTPATAADAKAVAEVVDALESSLYRGTSFTQADLEDDWSHLDLERDTRVVRDGDRVVGYCAVQQRSDPWRLEGYVHPDAQGRGIGKLLAGTLEELAVAGGASRVQNHVLEADSAAGALLESSGYRVVRVFREMRIALDGPPPAPEWPAGARVVPFDPDRDAHAFHAAHQEAFADHWDYVPHDFESWSTMHLRSERFDPALWTVVRAGDEIVAGDETVAGDGSVAGDEIVAGAICTGDTYGGGFVHVVFTRRPWRRRGLGAALLADSFRRFWERGEHSVGLGVDAESATGAFHLYERAGMSPALGWLVYEKLLRPAGGDGPQQG